MWFKSLPWLPRGQGTVGGKDRRRETTSEAAGVSRQVASLAAVIITRIRGGGGVSHKGAPPGRRLCAVVSQGLPPRNLPAPPPRAERGGRKASRRPGSRVGDCSARAGGGGCHGGQCSVAAAPPPPGGPASTAELAHLGGHASRERGLFLPLLEAL